MAAPNEFPNNCTTNVYTLNDFGEIAYIVCTVANPPSQDASVSINNINTLENTVARLRRTERQFREASILAALDVEARQLFTFYKKVDIANAKDQKTLLSKFGFVLRSNACTIAYKTAARLPDLMKPEQARLYRLFTTAIVSSIKISPPNDCELYALGPNLYLVQCPLPSPSLDETESVKRWTVHRVDLQVIPSGHIILTIAREDGFSFVCLTEAALHLDGNTGAATNLALYLAPVSTIARLTTPGMAHINPHVRWRQTAQESENALQDAKEQAWRQLLPPWLREHTSYALEETDTPWVEVQIAVLDDDVESLEDAAPQKTSLPLVTKEGVAWKTIYWPANLCFLVNKKITAVDESSIIRDDPLKFVQTWINGAGGDEGIDGTKRQQASFEDDDEPLFTEDGPFDDPDHFQPFGPPAFPASQTIYPTPPDVVMTHTTPGFSSVDGIAVTPANLSRGPVEELTVQDEEMPDFDEPINSGIGPGYYDEDLFEEMPDDNFGQEGTGDEPNWDFFDQPGIESKDTPLTAHQNSSQITNDNTNDRRVESKGHKELDTSSNEEHFSEAKSQPFPSGRDAPSPSRQGRQPSLSAVILHDPNLETSNSARDVFSGLEASSDGQNCQNVPPDKSARRRSSAYDGIRSFSASSVRDSRYAADGAYWFDPSPAVANTKEPPKLNTFSYMRPSSPSESDDSSVHSFSMSIDRGSTNHGLSGLSRQWTEYQPESPGIQSQHSEVETSTTKEEVQQILDSLPYGLLEPPSLREFDLSKHVHDLPAVSSQKFLQVAQILVDQVSQTSLIAHRARKLDNQTSPEDSFQVGADLSGINTSASPSLLHQLISLKADNNQVQSQGRVTKLQPPPVHVRRAGQLLTASISILGFWDILNLQPESGPKNATAFCIHPNSQNVADGCSNLLQRMGDAYAACTLGTHEIGRVPGLSNDGLVAWSSSESPRTNLQQTCQRFGKALSSTSELKGVIVVYMISRSDNMADYLEICYAFHALFESFMQSVEKKNVVDIALQIVPQDFVAREDTLVIPSQATYLGLALEVYNRLPPSNLQGRPGICGSAVSLAKAELSVHLRLSANSSSPMSKNGPCLHVAYSISLDDRWITAAWTDEFGKLALTISYCTQISDSSPRRPRQDILKEIWEVSHDLIGKVEGTWRLNVVKDGHYDPNELSEWDHVVEKAGASQKGCALVLLSIQLNPMVRILPQSHLGRNVATGGQNLYGTPASTPQAGITSPDQLVPATPTPGGSGIVNAPTPPEPGFDPNVESDLTLLDPAEESWSVVLPYGVNQTTNMIDFRPSLATGLLIKRKGIKGEDGHTSIEVNLIKVVHSSSHVAELSMDELLEDVIKQYRGLVTLAVSRGCVNQSTDCLPWHFATAMRGAHVLGEVM